MNETVEIILWLYAAFAAALFALGVLEWRGGREQEGARLMLAAIPWPLVVPLLVVKAAIVWVPRVWRAAWW